MSLMLLGLVLFVRHAPFCGTLCACGLKQGTHLLGLCVILQTLELSAEHHPLV